MDEFLRIEPEPNNNLTYRVTKSLKSLDDFELLASDSNIYENI